MKGIRRKEKEIKDREEIVRILQETKYITLGMCKDNIPYLVTLNYGYDPERHAIYFHCAQEGKKVDILKSNNVVWGQALLDKGYMSGKCDHLYATTQFKGTATFIDDIKEKKHALITMINQLEPEPEKIINRQITAESLKKVNVGRIDITHLSGKKSEKVIITL